MGGSAALPCALREFAEECGGRSARVAILMQGGDRSHLYLKEYTEPLNRGGAGEVSVIMGDGKGGLDQDGAERKIAHSAGIFICGGKTPVYPAMYGPEGIGSVICDKFLDGVPVGGVSAGALMLPSVCAIPPEDTGAESVSLRPGLGLIEDLIVGVHFSEWNALPHVLAAMSCTRTVLGLGLDQAGCAVLKDGEIVRHLGSGVHVVEMTDFNRQEYVLRKRC